MSAAVFRDLQGHVWQRRVVGGQELLLRKVAGQPALYGVYQRGANRWTLAVLSRRRVETEHTFVSQWLCFETAARTDAARQRATGTRAQTGTNTVGGTVHFHWNTG